MDTRSRFLLLVVLTIESVCLGTLRLGAAAFDVCYSEQCQKVSKFFKDNMDEQTSECDDFAKHATGRFAEGKDLSTYHGIYDVRDYINENFNEEISELLNHARSDELEATTKIRIFYSSCLNEEIIEERGLSTIEIALDDVGLPLLPPIYNAYSDTRPISVYLGRLHKFAHFAKFLFKGTFIRQSLCIDGIFFTFENDIVDINKEIYGYMDDNTFLSVTNDNEFVQQARLPYYQQIEEQFMKNVIIDLYEEEINQYTQEDQIIVRQYVEYNIANIRQFLHNIRELMDTEIGGSSQSYTLYDLQRMTNFKLHNSEIKLCS